MSGNHTSQNEEPKFWRTIRDDLRNGNFFKTLRRDFIELKEFYLDKNQQTRLSQMGKIKRGFVLTFWLLRILFFKLTSTRRLLLLISLILILSSDGGDNTINGGNVFGGLLLLFVLMLELKDKLLARYELAEGHAIQTALMPEQTPRLPGWDLYLYSTPANEVGGDLVDFLQIDEHQYGIALGDVAGKGLGAALFMAKLQATLRAVASDFQSLEKLGNKLNSIFYRDTLPKSFASLVYLEIRSDYPGVRLLNAGHMPPIILKGSLIEETPKGAPALGLTEKASFTEQSIKLEPEELLLVYSDGLTEAQNEEMAFFSEERLFALLPKLRSLSSKQVGERLLAEVHDFRGEMSLQDDLSLIILRRLAK